MTKTKNQRERMKVEQKPKPLTDKQIWEQDFTDWAREQLISEGDINDCLDKIDEKVEQAKKQTALAIKNWLDENDIKYPSIQFQKRFIK